MGEFGLHGVRNGKGRYMSFGGEVTFGTWSKDAQTGLCMHRREEEGVAKIFYQGHARNLLFNGFGILEIVKPEVREEMAG